MSLITPKVVDSGSFVTQPADATKSGIEQPEVINQIDKHVNSFISNHKFGIFIAIVVAVLFIIIWKFKEQLVEMLINHTGVKHKVDLLTKLLEDKDVEAHINESTARTAGGNSHKKQRNVGALPPHTPLLNKDTKQTTARPPVQPETQPIDQPTTLLPVQQQTPEPQPSVSEPENPVFEFTPVQTKSDHVAIDIQDSDFATDPLMEELVSEIDANMAKNESEPMQTYITPSGEVMVV